MDKSEALSLVKKFGTLVCTHMPVAGVWLYGSYAQGTQREESDIDVAVSLDSMPDDFLAASKTLFRLRRKLDSRIEPVLIDPEHDRSGFSAMVQERGIRAFP